MVGTSVRRALHGDGPDAAPAAPTWRLSAPSASTCPRPAPRPPALRAPALVAIFYLSPPDVRDRAASIVDPTETTNRDRIAMARAGGRMIADRPVVRPRPRARQAVLPALSGPGRPAVARSPPPQQRSSDRGRERSLRRRGLPGAPRALLRANGAVDPRGAESSRRGSRERNVDLTPGGGHGNAVEGRSRERNADLTPLGGQTLRGRGLVAAATFLSVAALDRRSLRVQLRRQGSVDGDASASRPAVLPPGTIVSRVFPRPVPAAAPPRPYTVSELLAEVGGSLRPSWRDVAVVGEISRWEVRGGHGYFTLKDRTGCLNAIIFASDRERIPFKVEPGLEVVVRGSLDLWAPQGKFQIKAYQIEPVGAGALQLAFEQLKARLAAEGLFDPARKRRIPLLPQSVAVVTSPDGAAIRDIVNVLRRRHDGLAVTIYPARVQGAGGRARDRRRHPRFQPAGWLRRADRDARRRLSGGPRALQRRARRPRARGLPDSDDLRRRPRDRRHHLRPRRGPSRGDAFRRGRARGARRRRSSRAAPTGGRDRIERAVKSRLTLVRARLAGTRRARKGCCGSGTACARTRSGWRRAWAPWWMRSSGVRSGTRRACEEPSACSPRFPRVAELARQRDAAANRRRELDEPAHARVRAAARAAARVPREARPREPARRPRPRVRRRVPRRGAGAAPLGGRASARAIGSASGSTKGDRGDRPRDSGAAAEAGVRVRIRAALRSPEEEP